MTTAYEWICDVQQKRNEYHAECERGKRLFFEEFIKQMDWRNTVDYSDTLEYSEHKGLRSQMVGLEWAGGGGKLKFTIKGVGEGNFDTIFLGVPHIHITVHGPKPLPVEEYKENLFKLINGEKVS